MNSSKQTSDLQFKQSMTLHLNGGSEFSQLHYNILLDDNVVATRHTKTDGSPSYNVVADEFHIGEKTYDAVKDGIEGCADWISDNMEQD